MRHLEDSELERIRREVADDRWFYEQGRPGLSSELFERVALGDDFVDFLTLVAYEHLECASGRSVAVPSRHCLSPAHPHRPWVRWVRNKSR